MRRRGRRRARQQRTQPTHTRRGQQRARARRRSRPPTLVALSATVPADPSGRRTSRHRSPPTVRCPSTASVHPASGCVGSVRYRKAKIQERGREVQRVEKTLQDAGIKLSSVASEVLGVSARNMLDALICGTHDPEILAELPRARCARRSPRCARRSPAASPATTRCSFLRCSRRSTSWTRRSRRSRHGSRSLTRPFSREIELLDTIPGVDKRAAEMLLAEIGPT